MIISTDELNKYFGKEVTPAKMKEQIMALLDEWKEKQPPNWQSRRRKTSSTSDRAPLLDTLSRGTRPALGMGSAVIYPPSPGFMLHSREWAVKGRNARRILRWPAPYGLPRLCYFPRQAAGVYPPEPPPLSLDRERAGG